MKGKFSLKKDTIEGIKTLFGSEEFSLTKEKRREEREEAITQRVNPDWRVAIIIYLMTAQIYNLF